MKGKNIRRIRLHARFSICRCVEGKYSINSLVYWVTYVHNVVYSFYRSMIYCYINSTQRCAGSIVIDIIPTNGADKRKFFPFAPYFPVTNVIKRYFYPYFPAIIGIKGYSFPYFPYLSGIMKIKTALYSLFYKQLDRLNELKRHSGFHVPKPLFHHYSWFTAVKYLSIVVAFFIAFFIFRSASGSRYSQ